MSYATQDRRSDTSTTNSSILNSAEKVNRDFEKIKEHW